MWDKDIVNAGLDAACEVYMEKTPSSLQQLRALANTMPLGVASSFQSHFPYPFVIDHASGSWVTDIDHNRYLDVHGGFGVNVLGHGNKDIARAITLASEGGNHYAAPHRALRGYAEALGERFRLQQLRLCPSGTEATMDAIRLARAYTDREIVVKIEGSYHGHHDFALLSTKPDPEEAGWPPQPVPSSKGIITGTIDAARVIALNDIDMLRALFDTEGEQIAAIIIEPILCNLGFTRATEEFLQAAREITLEYGSVLIWDEVKTGATVAYGGVGDLIPYHPDLLCLGKAVGGGLPIGVVGGNAAIMHGITDWSTPHYGTFSGNPIAVAAGSVALEQLTPDVYTTINIRRQRMSAVINADIAQYDLPLHTDGEGFKGGIFYSPSPCQDYRDWRERTDSLLAQWGWLEGMNAGVWAAPGADEQWTLATSFGDEEEAAYLQAWQAWREKLVASRPL